MKLTQVTWAQHQSCGEKKLSEYQGIRHVNEETFLEMNHSVQLF